jgi:hypothetical protein
LLGSPTRGAFQPPIPGHDMHGRKDDGPEARGTAPAGPEKLSAADGASPTLSDSGRRAGMVEPLVIAMVVQGHVLAGYFEGRVAGDDRVFVSSRTPFCDAARMLLELGFDGAAVLEMKHDGSTTECLRAPLSVAAGQTVEESAHGPVFRRHRGSRSAVGAAGASLGEWAATLKGLRSNILGNASAAPKCVLQIPTPRGAAWSA